jgi:hypothetical protein
MKVKTELRAIAYTAAPAKTCRAGPPCIAEVSIAPGVVRNGVGELVSRYAQAQIAIRCTSHELQHGFKSENF